MSRVIPLFAFQSRCDAACVFDVRSRPAGATRRYSVSLSFELTHCVERQSFASRVICCVVHPERVCRAFFHLLKLIRSRSLLGTGPTFAVALSSFSQALVRVAFDYAVYTGVSTGKRLTDERQLSRLISTLLSKSSPRSALFSFCALLVRLLT